MESTRRAFMRSIFTCATLMTFPRLVQGAGENTKELPRPNPSLFQSGDLIWPKKPGAYVPYNSGSKNAPDQDRVQWEREKQAYLEKQKKAINADDMLRRRNESLNNMDYREFIATYEGNQTPGVPGLYSGGSLYVGHVGILDLDQNQKVWVIEAVLGEDKRVVKRTYEEWIEGRSDEVVWLGRLREVPLTARAKIAQEATKYINRPYDFWNFDLNDDSGFYCSKLVWMSIFRALRFPVDGNPDPSRSLWFSPKQLMNSPTIDLLHDPGPYAIR